MSPRASYMRRVCGCISASSAATEIMKTPRFVSSVVVVRTRRVRWELLSSRAAIGSNLRAPGGRVAQQLLARVVVVHVLGEVLQGSLLVTAQLARNLDLEAVVDVAPPLAVRAGWALAAETLHGAVLGARGYADALGPAQRRHLHRRPSDRLRNRDRHRHLEVAVAALAEDGRGRHASDDVEVTRRATERTVLPLARDPDLGAVANPGGNLHPIALGLSAQAGAAAGRTGILDDLAAPAALGAGLADREEPLALPLDPAPAAAVADLGGGARLGAGAAAGVAPRLLGNADGHLGAGHRLRKAERDLGLEVAPRDGLAGGAAAPPEERTEDVADVGGETATRAAEAAGGAEAGEGAARVVLAPLLRVGQNVIGLLDLLEALLGSSVPGVAIGMVLADELAVGLLDVLCRGLAVDAEDLVEVARSHGLLRDDDARWADHLTVEAVAELDRLQDGAGIGAFLRSGGQGLVERRVELLTGRVVGGDACAVERGSEVSVDELDALSERVVLGSGVEGSTQVVDHGNQVAGDRGLAAFLRVRGLLGGPLAEVLEVGTGALREVQILVALALDVGEEGVEVGVNRFATVR